MTEADGPRRRYAAEQAYYWALIASDLRDDARTAARRALDADPESATPWQQWAVTVPPSTTRQQASELALMWVKVASVQEDEEP